MSHDQCSLDVRRNTKCLPSYVSWQKKHVSVHVDTCLDTCRDTRLRIQHEIHFAPLLLYSWTRTCAPTAMEEDTAHSQPHEAEMCFEIKKDSYCCAAFMLVAPIQACVSQRSMFSGIMAD